MKLLRKCRCPVWITQPRKHRQLSSVVAATDFSLVCDCALDLAASLVELNGAALHIVHALSLSDEATMRRAGMAEADILQYRQHAERHAQDEMQRLLARESIQALPTKPAIHIEVGEADKVILQQVDVQSADLLAMGTLARSGLSGVLMGNTAERLLPQIDCSLLAVKPEDFVCPIRFHKQRSAAPNSCRALKSWRRLITRGGGVGGGVGRSSETDRWINRHKLKGRDNWINSRNRHERGTLSTCRPWRSHWMPGRAV